MILRMGVVQSTSSVVFFGIDIIGICAMIAVSLEDSERESVGLISRIAQFTLAQSAQVCLAVQGASYSAF
jgi:hypothetical protein